MSFRLFIYYCALCGGWAAFFGWAFGRLLAPSSGGVLEAGVKGMMLGLFVALVLGALDAVWNLSWTRFGPILMRVGVALLVGAFGGLLGGLIGQGLYGVTQGVPVLANVFLVFGWALTGLLIGASVGVFEVLSGAVRQKDLGGAVKKMVKALVGGTVGGVLGGVLYLMLAGVWLNVFSGKDPKALWSPSATGFVALGMCIGLLIGLAQVILKEAWVRVEEGFRPGREKILDKERTTIGRAEANDIGMFGDMDVAKEHAVIVLEDNRYYLEDVGTPGGTYLNDQRINGRTPLKTGDRIRVGKSVLRFRERQKRGPE